MNNINNKHLKIIAEIAQGYEGDFKQSKLFIKAASSAGADAVKFQLVFADEICTKEYKYYNLFKSLEMGKEKWGLLNEYSNNLGIEFIVDIFGYKSLKTAEEIGLKTVKVHATDLTNIDLIKKISLSKISTVILGAGGSYINEIEDVVKILNDKKLEILLGFQGYPTKIEDNNISRISFVNKKIRKIHQNFKIGFAAHPTAEDFQNLVSVTAIGSGAEVIEKHLTLGKVMKIEDYESALNPDEFFDFVKRLKASFSAYGSYNNPKLLSKSEENYRNFARKDIVALVDLDKNTVIAKDHIALKRTGNVDAIKSLDFVIGKELTISLKKDQPFLKKILK